MCSTFAGRVSVALGGQWAGQERKKKLIAVWRVVHLLQTNPRAKAGATHGDKYIYGNGVWLPIVPSTFDARTLLVGHPRCSSRQQQ